MVTNSELTLYHKGLDPLTRNETWTRYNYSKIWWFGGKGASTNKGYENVNDVQIRIPYNQNEIDINNIGIGDIVIQGNLDLDIYTQQDLKGYQVYNITSINNNTFGSEPHVHLSGR